MLQVYKTLDGYRLGAWVSKQRAKENSISREQKIRLEALPGWVWAERRAVNQRPWDEWFDALNEFAKHEGHCLPVALYKTPDGYGLGSWVSAQREKKGKLPPDRKARLEVLPRWSWNPFLDKWEKGFRHLKEFAEREGQAKVNDDYQTVEGYRLGGWVSTQRIKKDKLSPERKARLEVLPGWTWDTRADNWEEGFRHLKELADQGGRANVPHSFKTTDGFRVGQWVAVQRRTKDNMSSERRVRLEALPGWTWDAIVDKWEEGFLYLKEFADREGHAKVSRDYKSADGYRVGQWASVQRATKDNMTPERKARLEALPGWSWDPLRDMWGIGLYSLIEYVKREGHAKVPQGYKTADGYRVGSWVAKQRVKKDGMSSEQKAQLEALPGWVWRIK